MTNRRERLFWTSCLPLRVVIALAAVVASVEHVRALQLLLAAYLGVWGVGMWYNFALKLREPRLEARLRALPPDAAEARKRLEARLDETRLGNFGGPVWWQWPRLVHGALLIAYAATTAARWPPAHWFAVVDVALAALFGLLYYRCGCVVIR